MSAAPIEILAPAGDEDALRAAVYSGADAVYLGLTSFSARRTAGNFTPAALKRAVGFCHARGVRVHVAINTLLFPAELPDAAEAVRAAAEAGADAVIVQDLAAAALVRRIAPGLALHGSTQMSIHTAAGARQLEAMGFARAILARELSLAEIKAIRQQTGIELEVFVHGALCVSVSGQCMMSAFLGGRSGNRGSCAGSCRLPFSASGAPEGDYHLSLKDLSVIDRLPDLAAAGVCSAKIEGRMRGPEYVAGAVSACLAARSGQPYDAQLLQDAFSRSGFTSAYLDGTPGRAMFGVRTGQDAAASRAALPRLRGLYRRERPAVPVRFAVEFAPGGAGPVRITARDAAGRTAAAQTAEPPQPPNSDPLPAIQRALEKTGGTPFFAETVEVSGPPGYLPGSVWNELRRDVLAQLLTLREAPAPHPLALQPAEALPATGHKPAPSAARPLPLWARFAAAAQLPQNEALLAGLERLILPIAEAEAVPEPLRPRTILELPRAMFGPVEADTARRIAACRGMGFAGLEANNLAHIPLAKEQAPGLALYGGFGLNITNQLAAAEYERLGLAGLTLQPELPAVGMPAIGPPAVQLPTGALIYGHMPLMLTRACPLQNATDCAHCNGTGELTDRKGMRLPVRCGLGVRSIYNPIPLYLGDKSAALAVDYALAYFTIEPAPRAAEVLRLLAAHAPFDGSFTRGLAFKTPG